jgi:hypothetical protein
MGLPMQPFNIVAQPIGVDDNQIRLLGQMSARGLAMQRDEALAQTVGEMQPV